LQIDPRGVRKTKTALQTNQSTPNKQDTAPKSKTKMIFGQSKKPEKAQSSNRMYLTNQANVQNYTATVKLVPQ
jgi:nitrous oxide reductase accessory protein NosL